MRSALPPVLLASLLIPLLLPQSAFAGAWSVPQYEISGTLSWSTVTPNHPDMDSPGTVPLVPNYDAAGVQDWSAGLGLGTLSGRPEYKVTL